VPLLGVTIDPFQLVSIWMSDGELLDHLGRNPDADRPGLVGVPVVMLSHAHSCPKLSNVAEGVRYLHSRNIVHGDLKGVRGFLNIILLPS